MSRSTIAERIHIVTDGKLVENVVMRVVGISDETKINRPPKHYNLR